MKPEVIIVGQNPSIILGFIRDLGAGGFAVHVIKTNGLMSYECKSKYVKSYRLMNKQDEISFADFMIRYYSSQFTPKVVLPADDRATLLVDSVAPQLLPYFFFPSIEQGNGRISCAMDKWYQKQVALNAGLNVAKGWQIVVKDGNYIIPNGLVYPCFVKPSVYDANRKTHMFKCTSEEELYRMINGIQHKIPLIAEEYVEIDSEKAVLGLNTNQGLLISGIVEAKDMLNGVTSVGIAHYIDPTSSIVSLIKKFLDKIGYYGLFDIDFLESKGELFFCELNIRLGNSGVPFLKKYKLSQLFVKSLMGSKIDLNCSEYSDFSFADERVCQAKCSEEKLSFHSYYNMIKSVDVRFIKDRTDIRPYLSFQKFLLGGYIKRLLLK